MFIPEQQVNHIHYAVPLVDVIQATGYRVIGTGRSKGVERCPSCGRDFTHIKINTRKNLFKCFSEICGFTGNQFQWIMKVENVSFQEAVLRVAEIGNIEINPVCKPVSQAIFKKQKALQLAVLFYKNQFSDYLNVRGIAPNTQKKYHTGFARGGKRLKNHLNNKGFDDEFLDDLGLIRSVPGIGYMDRFFNSIIIPDIRDGKVIDLYARSIDDQISTKHMYLNGHQSMIGSHLVQRGRPLIICEGPINAMSAFQITGIPAISIGGAGKFDKWHLNRLKLSHVQPILCFDNDATGVKATLAAIEIFATEDIFTRVIALSEHNDINDYLVNDHCMNIEEAMISSEYFVYNYHLSQVPISYIQDFISRAQTK